MAPSSRMLTAVLFSPLTLLIGCGYNPAIPLATPAAHLSGRVHGGQQPISGSTVTVWQVGNTGYGSAATALASTTSLSDGSFDIPTGSYTCPTTTTEVYMTAQGGSASPGFTNSAIELAAGIGNCSALDNQQVEINEVSTVVTAFALVNFFGVEGSPATSIFGAPASNMSALTLSNTYTIPTLLNVANGTVNPNTSTVTIEAAKIYSLADSLAACVNSTATSTACTDLITATSFGFAPTDTFEAAIVVAAFPYNNVATIYDLGSPTSPFIGLGSAPNDWTIGVSYTTPAMGLGILGTTTSRTSSNIDIDTSGRIWFPSNLPGKTGIGYFDPATATFTGPLNATGVTLI
jgi:hypothetical protein